jgi:hypothetical protein
MNLHSLTGVLFPNPKQKFLHLRFVPQFVQGVEFFGKVLVIKQSVDLPMTSRADIDGMARVCFSPFGILPRS